MVTNNEIGELEIINLPRLHPFVVKFENFEEANAIQVDVAGIGAFRYFAPISDDILLQIHTNINKKLRIYGKKSGHNPENIGYNLNFNPIKKINTATNTPMIGVDIAIFFKKPVKDASGYALQPTITVISHLIISEIFILSTK